MSSPAVLVLPTSSPQAGAGPSGLILALALQQNGVNIRIIDKLSNYHVGERGAGMMPRTQEIHELLGTLPDIQKYTMAVPFMRPHDTDGVTPLKIFHMSPYVEPIPANPYEEVLRARLGARGCKVEAGYELRSFSQDSDGVNATIVHVSDGQEIVEEARFQYLVGADGAHSVVRKQLGISFLGETRLMENMIIGDILIEEGITREFWNMWGNPQTGMITLRPTNPNPKLFTFIVSGRELNHEEISSGREKFIEAFYKITNRKEVVFGDLIWISNYRPNIRMVDEFGKGRVFLTGDAAHCHSITGGQGMNTSIQDSVSQYNSRSRIKRASKPSLLETYTYERVPVIAEMLQKTTRLLDKTFKPQHKENGAWDRSGELHQLGVNYRGGPIVVDERNPVELKNSSSYLSHPSGVCAGDRAPDATGLVDVRNPGGPRRLFSTFSTAHHSALFFGTDYEKHASYLQTLRAYRDQFKLTLIVPQDDGSSTTAEQFAEFDYVMRDDNGSAYAAYGVAADTQLVLVRPDAYVGAILTRVDGLQKYLEGIFV
uniref:FAD-binding protein n=1 Tax=Volvariella volvacea TaxID=36659 RepID=M9Z687_9AGAR|nr:FAD-binding protein [Volvariella volvacea]